MSPLTSRESRRHSAGSGAWWRCVSFARPNPCAVPFPGTVEGLVENFLTAYKKRYGAEAVPEKAGFEFVTYVVEAVGLLPRPDCARYP